MPQIVFPKSTAPGKTPNEGGGRLINAYADPLAEGAANTFVIRRDAGLRKIFSPTTAGKPRGAIYVNGTLYYICGTKAYAVTGSGDTYTVTQLTGTVSGDGRATMAANMKAPTKDILANTDSADYSLTSTTVSSFSDGDLPSANSVCYVGSYFVWSIAAGQAYASGINATTVAGTDFATAESNYDGLKRAIGFGQDLFLFGDATIEVWSNVGNETGFPFTRATVIPIGLIGTFAVAGFDAGFPGPPAWVGNDHKVYMLDGRAPRSISSPELEKLIKDVSDKSALELSVFMADGRPCLAVQSESWTWIYNYATGWWHERQSYQSDRWNFSLGVEAFNEWVVFDKDNGDAYIIDGDMKTENLEPLNFEVWSSPKHSFPLQSAFIRTDFYFKPGVGSAVGQAPIEQDPTVRISWSSDGGVTFSNPVVRKLGEQGKYKNTVSVHRAGRASRYGRIWKLQISDPVDAVLIGGFADIRETQR